MNYSKMRIKAMKRMIKRNYTKMDNVESYGIIDGYEYYKIALFWEEKLEELEKALK